MDLTGELRQAMRRETEMYFGYILHEDRSILELLESDYTFLNEKLARHYGLTNLDLSGSECGASTLPQDCPRGGILTMGTVLAVTSNPTRNVRRLSAAFSSSTTSSAILRRLPRRIFPHSRTPKGN